MNLDSFDEATATFFTSGYSLLGLVFYVLWAIAMWKVFAKAGYLGILAFVPVVNLFILVRISGYSAWLTLLYIIPIVGWIFSIFVAFQLGARFGKGGLFSFLWLWLFQVVGLFILGYGSSSYTRRPGR